MFRIVGIFGSRSTLYAFGGKNKQRILVLEKKKKKEKRGEGGGGGEGVEGGGEEAKEEEEKPGHRVISFRIDSFSTYICTCTYTCTCSTSLMSMSLCTSTSISISRHPGTTRLPMQYYDRYPDVHIFLLDPDIIPIE